MIDSNLLVIFFQILLAAILGMLVGAEREHRHKSAGLRTYTLVAIGSALFTILSVQGFSAFQGQYDPSRIAGQIVVGIGFIGAGLIIFKENRLEGLTSAAGIWVIAAIGMAVGLGFYQVAVFATLLVLAVFFLLSFLKEKISSDD